MTQYFECLHCGTFTPVASASPTCKKCGHGTGVIHLKEPEESDSKVEWDKRDSANGKKTEDPAAMLESAL